MMSWPDFNYKQIIVHITEGKDEKLKFRADNIVIVNKEEKILLQHSCHRIFALFIIGEISVTSVLIKHCIMYHFPILLMNRSLKVIAKFNCAAEGNTFLRKQQYTNQSQYHFEIAKYLIGQKIHNQCLLIGKIRQKSHEDKEVYTYLQNISTAKAASKVFFSTYYRPLHWNRREPRCKRDIPNLLLDIGYTWLFQFLESLLSLYGFDLYCGVYHTFFYQRKSLVCDIIEPFRCIIDERIRKAYNLGQLNVEDFGYQNGQYYLEYKKQQKYTSLFLKDILAYKEDMFKFCQAYYRCYIRGKDFNEFPIFQIK